MSGVEYLSLYFGNQLFGRQKKKRNSFTSHESMYALFSQGYSRCHKSGLVYYIVRNKHSISDTPALATVEIESGGMVLNRNSSSEFMQSVASSNGRMGSEEAL